MFKNNNNKYPREIDFLEIPFLVTKRTLFFISKARNNIRRASSFILALDSSKTSSCSSRYGLLKVEKNLGLKNIEKRKKLFGKCYFHQATAILIGRSLTKGASTGGAANCWPRVINCETIVTKIAIFTFSMANSCKQTAAAAAER